MYRLPLGASLGFGRNNYYENVLKAKELGFEYIDFDIATFWSRPFKERRIYRSLEKGIAAIKDADLKINAVHISFGTRWDPAERKARQREKNVSRIVKTIRRLDPYGPFLYVLHGSFEPIAAEEREERKNILMGSLKEICAATKNTICVEILPRTCLFNTSAEAAEVLDKAKINNLRICLDTNHFLQEKTEDAVLSLAGRIATLHVSDHDYVDERHLLPGEGKIDWNAVLAALEKTGYNGVFNYEVKAHIPLEDIRENYEKLFSEYNKTRLAIAEHK